MIYYLEDGTKICARPSGTEPKIKFYFSVNTVLESKEQFNELNAMLTHKIETILTEMHLT